MKTSIRFYHLYQKWITSAGKSVKPDDLLITASDLIRGPRRLRQSNLRRACSTTYYALFHTLCRCCADTMVSDKSTKRAWVQAYRFLKHGHVKNQCAHKRIADFPDEIQDFADMFVQMQEKRHRADYDPTGIYYKSAVKADIDAAKTAIDAFTKSTRKDKRAFVIFVALDGPK